MDSLFANLDKVSTKKSVIVYYIMTKKLAAIGVRVAK